MVLNYQRYIKLMIRSMWLFTKDGVRKIWPNDYLSPRGEAWNQIPAKTISKIIKKVFHWLSLFGFNFNLEYIVINFMIRWVALKKYLAYPIVGLQRHSEVQ